MGGAKGGDAAKGGESVSTNNHPPDPSDYMQQNIQVLYKGRGKKRHDGVDQGLRRA